MEALSTSFNDGVCFVSEREGGFRIGMSYLTMATLAIGAFNHVVRPIVRIVIYAFV